MYFAVPLTGTLLSAKDATSPVKFDPSISVSEHENVYPPSEDSRLLIESLDVREGERVLEIGCGSGIVSLHCASNGAEVVCVDINPDAVELTRRNFSNNSLKADVRLSDLYSSVTERFDTIVFNLPYLPENDEGMLAKAWSGGDDGIGPLPELLEEGKDHLLPGGRIVIVVSSLMDQERLSSLLSKYEVRELGSLHMFFETLKVLEIRAVS